MLELPEYRKPHWKNVFILCMKSEQLYVWCRKNNPVVSAHFVVSGKFWSEEAMQEAVNVATIESSLLNAINKLQVCWCLKKLEASYAGYAGRLIEPVIKPLGFDWKISIALITPLLPASICRNDFDFVLIGKTQII